MTNQEIIEKLEEHQRELDDMQETDIQAVFTHNSWEDSRVGYFLAGLEHGLQIAIDLLEGR